MILPPVFRRRRAILLLAALAALICQAIFTLEKAPVLTGESETKDRPGTAPRLSSPAPPPRGAKSEINPVEDRGLWAALETARRGISPLTDAEAVLSGNEGVSHFAWNPGEDLTARFLQHSVRFGHGGEDGWQVNFAYQGGGAGSTLAVEGRRAEYHHPDGVREWFENIEAGVEHGFTLDRPKHDGATIEIALSGMSATADGSDLLLLDEAGRPRLRYSGLKAWDADGKDLTASMSPTPTGLRLWVDDRDARYPLTIDPLVTVVDEELEPAPAGTGASGEQFGHSVALDGDTALIGIPSDDTAAGYEAGSVHVFERAGDSWTLKARLIAADPKPAAWFGAAVALEGDTAVIGVPYDGPNGLRYPGSIRIWTRENGEWSQQARIDGITVNWNFVNLGWEVALSGDTVALGVRGEDAVYVYVREGTTWTLQQKITPLSPDADSFGVVALEGDTLVVGAPWTDSDRGAAFYYTRTAGVWSGREIPRPAAVATHSTFGATVSISGNTLMVGAWGAESLYVFQKPGATWATPQRVVFNHSNGSYANVAVALQGDLALVGTPEADEGFSKRFGGVHVLRRGVTGFWFIDARLSNPSPSDSSKFGGAVALDGTSALVGASAHRTAAANWSGSATFFNVSGREWTTGVTLDAGDDGQYNQYGQRVATAGNSVAFHVASESMADGKRHQAVHVFSRDGDGWTREARFTDDIVEYPGSRYGEALAMSEDRLIIGIPGRVTETIVPVIGLVVEYGGAEIYERRSGEWILGAELRGSSYFGSAVDIDGDTAVIGAPYDPDSEGSAFIHTRGAGDWEKTAELRHEQSGLKGNFGSAVAVEDNILLVGAPNSRNEEKQPRGSVQVYRREKGEWVGEALLTRGVRFPYDGPGFGAAVALSGNTALVGAVSGSGCYYDFFSRRNKRWTFQDEGYSGPWGNQVALHGDLAVIGTSSPYHPPQLLEFRSGQWVQAKPLPAGPTAVALGENFLVLGEPDHDGINPIDGALVEKAGRVIIHEFARAEAYLVQHGDEDGDGAISQAEWLKLFRADSASGKAFLKIDADQSGQVTPEELVSAKGRKNPSSAVGSVMSRTAAFMDLDSGLHETAEDGRIDRAELREMWMPGTSAAVIDAFWQRADLSEGFDLALWLNATTLPSIPTYHEARVLREQRRRLVASYDFAPRGSIDREEFSIMMRQVAGTDRTGAAWSTLTGYPGGRNAPYSISAEEFVEAKNFPASLQNAGR